MSRFIRINIVRDSGLEFRLKARTCISGHVQIQGWTSPLQIHRDERVNINKISSFNMSIND